jgi:cytochrome c oxidase subunit 2
MPNTRHAYDHVAGIYLPSAVGVFAFVVATLLALLVAGRLRTRAPSRRHEARAFELGTAVVLAGVVAFLVRTTFVAETPIDKPVASPGLRIKVTAGQWSWRSQYPNGASVTAVSTWRPTPALVPTGTEVEFDGTSTDVIHGFQVPRLHFQRQLLPGYTTRFDLIFEQTGSFYSGQCSVYCGDQHGEMHFSIEAVTPAAFRAWLAGHAATQPGFPA